MAEWKPYLRERLLRQEQGFVAIVPEGAPPPVPLCCPVCDFAMRTREDEAAYQECECCNRCALLWAHPRRAAWKEGWRPTPEQIQAAERDRMPLALTFEVD